MSDMRPAPAATRATAASSARRGLRSVAYLALLAGLSAGLGAGPASATAPSPTTGPTADARPTLSWTLTPPPRSPFDEAVGGARLATVDEPAVSAGAPPLPVVDATTWLVADLGSGDVIAALGAHRQLPPASTIKLLTALAVLPAIDPRERYTATDLDTRTGGSRVGLVPGEEYSIGDLEHGMLLASGNDAAHALAMLVGGEGHATRLMNDEAERLGAFDTTAKTPHGLDVPGQATSVYDLALIARAVLADDKLATLVRTPKYDFPGLAGGTFQIQNHNRLLGSYRGAVGLKTGYTSLAGHTLVAAAERQGARLVAVVLGADGRAEPAAASLLDWGFTTREVVAPVGTLVTTKDVAAAVAQRDETPVAVAPAPQQALDDLDGAPAGAPMPAWVGLLAVPPVAGLVALWWRRRRRSSGRYAAG
ncbi:MAG: serine hydrolase [Jiangellaceae bacterium]